MERFDSSFYFIHYNAVVSFTTNSHSYRLLTVSVTFDCQRDSTLPTPVLDLHVKHARTNMRALIVYKHRGLCKGPENDYSGQSLHGYYEQNFFVHV